MIASLLPYPKYKASVIPWAKHLPDGWREERAKWLFQKMDRPTSPEDQVVTCFRDGTVTLRKNRRLRGFTEAIFELGYQGIKKGDLVIHAMDAFAGAVGVSDSDGKGTPVYAVCQPKKDANAHYYSYVIREMARSQWILALSRGIRERSTDFRFDTFGAQHVPIPSALEQAAIVRFLGWTCNRFDQAIHAKRKVIALLNEQKQAIIHHAVTRGLDPKVALKPTGVSWLGDIPKHWNAWPGKVGLREKQEKNTGLQEKQVLSLSYGRIVIKPAEKLRGLVPESFETYQIVNPGDIIIRPTDLQNDHTSLRVGYVRNRGIITSAYMCLQTLPTLNSEYAYQLLNSYDFSKVFYGLGSGTRQNLGFSDFKKLILVFPPADEQIKIIDFIKAKIGKVQPAITRLEREIELLREYRMRLVSDIVTGKLDVRKAAEDLPVVFDEATGIEAGIEDSEADLEPEVMETENAH